MKTFPIKITWTTNNLNVNQCATICGCSVARMECRIACTSPEDFAKEARLLWNSNDCTGHAAVRSMHRMALDRQHAQSY